MKWMINTLVCLVLCWASHLYANQFRPENAWGGEIVFLLAIPLILANAKERTR